MIMKFRISLSFGLDFIRMDFAVNHAIKNHLLPTLSSFLLCVSLISCFSSHTPKNDEMKVTKILIT